jgi:hypothetical protein
VCDESRTHGGNGGDGKTQFGCASCPYPLCAKKLNDGMGGNPHWFYQGASEPLGLSRAGRSVPVSSMPLKGTGGVEANRRDARLG